MRSIFFSAAIVFSALLSGCSQENTIPDRAVPGPGKGPLGYKFKDSVLISQKYKPMWVQHVTTGFQRSVKNIAPAGFKTVEQVRNCRFSDVGGNTKLVNINIPGSARLTPVKSFTNKDFSESVKKAIKLYRKGGEEALAKSYYEFDSLYVTDVFVTDTEAPVHLVLSGDRRIWNLIVSDKAELKQVSVVGSRVAVTNVDPGTAVEFLSDGKLEACKVLPGREPEEHWRITSNADRDLIDKHSSRYRKYADWFYSMFKQYHHENLISAQSAAHVLVGSLPQSLDDRAPYRSVEGAEAFIPAGISYAAMPKEEFKKYYLGKIRDEMTRQAGGDISKFGPKK